MNLDHFLQLFVVKEKSFFPLFIQSAENIVKAADLLLEQTKETDPDNRRILAHRIKEHETAGDEVTDKIVDVLIDAYVTPFDRDDIHNKIAIYQPKDPSRKLIEIAEYIQKAAVILLEITRKFDTMRKDAKSLDQLCDDIKDIEHTVDDIYETYMSNLFEKEKDAIELVK